MHHNLQYIKNIGNHLCIKFKLDKIENKKEQKDNVDKEKYLRKEKDIIEKIQSKVKVDNANKMVENANDKLYVNADNTEK